MAANLDHPYRILINRTTGPGKTNALLKVISYQPDIDKIYSYSKDSYEIKYQLLNNKRKSKYLKHCDDSKTFLKYLNDMDNIYESTEECNPNKEQKILIVFDDLIADMLSN